MEQQLVCAQCQSKIFAEDGFTLVCQCCGLQVEKQANRYEDDDRDNLHSGSHIKGAVLLGTSKRKKGTIKEHAGTSKSQKRMQPQSDTQKDEDWSDYLLAYQKILKSHGDAAKDCFGIENAVEFDGALKKVWFQYLDKWKGSGVRLQGSFMEARKGCFKMEQPAQLHKRYFINNENVPGLSAETIEKENKEDYQKLYTKEYESLKSEFYKKKQAGRRGKSQGANKHEETRADTQSQLN